MGVVMRHPGSVILLCLSVACSGGTPPSSDSGTDPSPSTGPGCTPLPAVVDGMEVESGFCETGGIVHRPEVVDVGAAPTGACPWSDVDYDCEVDADCMDFPHGRCVQGPCNDIDWCNCRYGCTGDADCGADAYCEVLDQEANACMPAGCHTDEDCPAGELCRRAEDRASPDPYTLQCTSPEDTCGSGAGQLCAWTGERFESVGETTSTCE